MRGMRVVFAFLLGMPLMAQVMPEPGTPNPRIQTVHWQDGQVIRLTALPATGLTVLFAPGEQVEAVDADRSAIDARTSSEGDGLLLIPRRDGELGEINVNTDRRSYRFALRTGTDLMAAYVVRFESGPTSSELPAAFVQSVQPGFPPIQPMTSPLMTSSQAWSYRVKGDPAVRPASIRDDGARTVIAFPEGAALPAVFAIGPSGSEQVVNGYMRGDAFVIDEVWTELVFRIDAKKATARRNAKPDSTHG